MISTIAQKPALKLAKEHRPVFIQGLEDLYDLIVPIPQDLAPIVVKHHGFPVSPIDKPTVYFSAKEDENYHYLLYCVYHRMDWSYGQPGGPLRDSLDTHQHDFEGVLRAIPGDDSGEYEWACSVFHKELHLTRGWMVFSIESQGHGIFPVPRRRDFLTQSRNEVVYAHYRLVNINSEWSPEQWIKLRQVFNANGVNLPDQWNDWRIRKKYGKETDGLIFTDPAKLRELAYKCQLI